MLWLKNVCKLLKNIILSNIKAFQDYLQHEKKYSLHTITAYINDLSFFKEFFFGFLRDVA